MVVLRYIWTIWCLLWFVLSSLIAVIGYRIILSKTPTSNQLQRALIWSQTWAFWLLIGMGIRVKVRGKEKVQAYSKAIFVSNHQSFFDIPVCALANPHTFRFLSKAEIKKMPFIGYVLSRIYYSVDRSSSESKKTSMQLMSAGIQNGFPVHLYIEGTRNPNPIGFLPFQKGAAVLAIDNQIPIVGLYIHNSRNFLASKSFKGIGFGTIYAEWMDPIHVNAHSSISEIHELLLNQFEKTQNTFRF